MKKHLCLFLLIYIPLFFFGCQKPIINGDGHINNLTINSIADGRGVIIRWNQIEDIEGYDVISPDGDTALLDWDQNSYSDDSPSSTGIYTVYAVDSGERGIPSTISSAPSVSTSNSTIYSWNSTTPSGYGWNYITGLGTFYLCVNENRDAIDFYLNDEMAPLDLSGCDEPPYSGDKTTYINDMGTDDFFLAPDSGLLKSVPVSLGTYYAMKVQSNHYAKVHLISVGDSTNVTFSFQFQTINGLRIF